MKRSHMNVGLGTLYFQIINIFFIYNRQHVSHHRLMDRSFIHSLLEINNNSLIYEYL